jgi:hypothetical protein
MKTIEFFKQKNRDLEEKIMGLQESEEKSDIRDIKNMTKEIQMNRLRIMYLETKPTEEFINSEISRIQKKVDLIWSLYTPLDETKLPKSMVSKHRKEYGTKMDVYQLSEQLVELMYLAD